MYSVSLRFTAILVLGYVLTSLGQASKPRELRVCADPDNMPFSNRDQQGFENHLAKLVAQDLKVQLTYVWQRMGSGFVREYLDKSACDLLAGIPANYGSVLTTSPYYRSTYVFVFRRDQANRPFSLNDPALRNMKIGIQALAEDYTPPGAALARRGMQKNIVAFHAIGEDANSILRAIADQQIDTAIVWGPSAGYFARNYGNELVLLPVRPELDTPGLPFTFAISMGVRKTDKGLRDEVESILLRRRTEIQAILRGYGVPQLDPTAQVATEY